MAASPIPHLASCTAEIELLPWVGEVTEMVGLLIASRGPVTSIGDFCEVRTAGGRAIRSQVVGFRNERVLSMPLEEIDGLQLGDRVIARKNESQLRVSPALLGRVLDGFGLPIDGGPPVPGVGDLSAVHRGSLPPGTGAHQRAAGHGHSSHRRPAAVR